MITENDKFNMSDQYKKMSLDEIRSRKELLYEIIKGEKLMCDHKWVHFETHYLYIDNYPGSSEFKRIDRFFCEKCCEEKVIEKSCYDYENRHPEWFNWNNYERIQR